ncbi:hypothetical protein [Mucilaginibacter sp. KACC 22063]|uniref:hypothetical protein n=1 Tax=Mucilaginibacter sp. KACC 22063 TaxID=3025666 RepID=UPI002366DA00|nr:hypothetical protein [Mucilaginibacter sp. KACC 22063]WDF56902.1 hypothetical protein PQ461_07515 [Mucilaginibacter sp. KACC 22063]
MRTLLIEVKDIEQYLFITGTAEDRLLFDAKQIINPELKGKVADQQKVYELVNNYGRKQLKAELQTVFQNLVSTPEHRSFAQRIRSIFGPKN